MVNLIWMMENPQKILLRVNAKRGAIVKWILSRNRGLLLKLD